MVLTSSGEVEPFAPYTLIKTYLNVPSESISTSGILANFSDAIENALTHTTLKPETKTVYNEIYMLYPSLLNKKVALDYYKIRTEHNPQYSTSETAVSTCQ